MHDLGSVVVHLDLLDLENSGLLGRSGAPALVTVGPVVPDPWAGHVGDIILGGPLLDTVDVELDKVLSPINSVLMLGGSGVGGREDSLMAGLAITISVLVCEPEATDSIVVGLGVGVREPLNIGLLAVGLVEEHSWDLSARVQFN
jgi:hypothetical protein